MYLMSVTPTLPTVITISDSEEEAGEELEAAAVVENNDEEIEAEVSDEWQTQIDAEAHIARLRRELDAEYNSYSSLLRLDKVNKVAKSTTIQAKGLLFLVGLAYFCTISVYIIFRHEDALKS
ncbi:hypothetical protein INT45_007843 [Circinella minor]|uniref:Uncharacterized protein n=1 Tax=Circinella minor TaxID=1195481 RepID=A0A8H7RX65_9FUNG|nr:hypothetical protein INT45_007843 [Circinella minor]